MAGSQTFSPPVLSTTRTSPWNRLRRNLLSRILRHLPVGHLEMTWPDGVTDRFGNPAAEPRAAIVMHSWRAIDRIFAGGDIGFAESHIQGEWRSPDLAALFDILVANEKALSAKLPGMTLVHALNRLRHWRNTNTKRGSRSNISFHYDLGNDFYRAWLDPTMTYSAACFETGDGDLESAQLRKYRDICRALDVRPGQRILEIGCGWGGFAEIAAREFDAVVHGVTLSTEQLAYARRRAEEAGLADRVRFSLTDYRDLTGAYHHIVSIEMFEAVGQTYWKLYFERLRTLLMPGGRAFLQIITIDPARFQTYARKPDFIQRHVFPGGMLPTPDHVAQLSTQAGFSTESATFSGQDYARTLVLWRQAFARNWAAIEAQGFDSRFRRYWEYYLQYCEAGFRHGAIGLGRFVLA